RRTRLWPPEVEVHVPEEPHVLRHCGCAGGRSSMCYPVQLHPHRGRGRQRRDLPRRHANTSGEGISAVRTGYSSGRRFRAFRCRGGGGYVSK
ncbi:unnamed protein product, partial [Ectocarpus sp. 12 AP-2014]